MLTAQAEAEYWAMLALSRVMLWVWLELRTQEEIIIALEEDLPEQLRVDRIREQGLGLAIRVGLMKASFA